MSINVLSLFSGIGAFEKALTNLNIEHKVINYCEIDKYASKSYSAIHNIEESKNLVDVTKVDTKQIKEPIDLITYGFPCQDISIAGTKRGAFQTDEEGNFILDEQGNKKLTRSGLFYEAVKIIDKCKPKFAIAENVKALTSKKHEQFFKSILETLDDIGYNSYYQVLNAKDFGVPQNRERIFIISIRKDIDNHTFNFPKPTPLTKNLNDILDKEVEERYYLSDRMLDYILKPGTKTYNNRPKLDKKVASTINTSPTSHRSGIDNFVSKQFIETGVPVSVEEVIKEANER